MKAVIPVAQMRVVLSAPSFPPKFVKPRTHCAAIPVAVAVPAAKDFIESFIADNRRRD
jgi:hypothetical protein